VVVEELYFSRVQKRHGTTGHDYNVQPLICGGYLWATVKVVHSTLPTSTSVVNKEDHHFLQKSQECSKEFSDSATFNYFT
jgi:hypothetical protein